MTDVSTPPQPVLSRRNISTPPLPVRVPRETICPARAVRVMRTLGVLLLLLLVIVGPIGVIIGRNTGRTNNTGGTIIGCKNISLYLSTIYLCGCVEHSVLIQVI